MSTSKTLALAGMLALAGFGFACGSESQPAANNANKPAAPAPAAPAPAAPTAQTAAIPGLEGAGLAAYEAHCANCHGKDAAGTKGGAPSILAVADKHTSAEWQAYLKNPKIWDKDNHMPAMKLEDADSKALGDWLAATTGKNGGGKPAAEGEKDKAGKTEGVKKS